MIDSKLVTFINVAKIKNYTKTAEVLNMTQPAVTHHIQQLEDYYRVKLIRKKGRILSLTEEGELLLKYAKDLEASSMVIERTLLNKSSLIKKYNIGATLTIGEFILPRILGDHKKQHENIDIIMHVYNLEEITKRLGLGEFDLGIVEGPFDKSKFNYQKLQDDELVLAVSPKSTYASYPEVELSELINNGKLIMREKGSGTRMIFENKLLEMGISLHEVKTYMEIGSIGAIKSFVQANLGYTVISREAVKSEVEVGTLKIVPIKDVKIMREFNFIYNDKSPIDFVQNFIKFIIGT